MSEKMVMPGDRLAASEEYISGPGTYEKNGEVLATVMGRAFFNENEKIVSIIQVKDKGTLSVGDRVLGEVTNVGKSLVNVSIHGLDGGGNAGANESGVIHVSKVTEAFMDDARKAYKTGDLLRADVLQTSPSLQLSTREPELGVLKAWCGKCRGQLTNKSGKLYCPACERTESRKLAGDFVRFTEQYDS